MAKLDIQSLSKDGYASGCCLVCSVNEKQASSGKPYCECTLCDGTRKFTAKMWDSTKEKLQKFEKAVAFVELMDSPYNGKSSYILKKIEACTEQVSVLSFVKSAPVSPETMYDTVLSIVDSSVVGEYRGSLAELTTRMYEKNREKLLYWSAAEFVHHNYYSGLLYHTYRMVLAAQALADVYKSVNRELLFSATALHDIGKLKELDTDELGESEYTVNGQLFGHLLTGVMMVEKEAEKSTYDREKVSCLEHCIAAHHGQLEWGAIKLPCIEEATILHIVDYLDSRVEMYEAESIDQEPGSLSAGAIYGLDKVKIYLPPFKKNSVSDETEFL